MGPAQLSAACTALCDYWIRRWTAKDAYPFPVLRYWISSYLGSLNTDDHYFLFVYWALVAFSVAFSVVTTVAFVRCGLQASTLLQANMLAAVIR